MLLKLWACKPHVRLVYWLLQGRRQVNCGAKWGHTHATNHIGMLRGRIKFKIIVKVKLIVIIKLNLSSWKRSLIKSIIAFKIAINLYVNSTIWCTNDWRRRIDVSFFVYLISVIMDRDIFVVHPSVWWGGNQKWTSSCREWLRWGWREMVLKKQARGEQFCLRKEELGQDPLFSSWPRNLRCATLNSAVCSLFLFLAISSSSFHRFAIFKYNQCPPVVLIWSQRKREKDAQPLGRACETLHRL